MSFWSVFLKNALKKATVIAVKIAILGVLAVIHFFSSFLKIFAKTTFVRLLFLKLKQKKKMSKQICWPPKKCVYEFWNKNLKKIFLHIFLLVLKNQQATPLESAGMPLKLGLSAVFCLFKKIKSLHPTEHELYSSFPGSHTDRSFPPVGSQAIIIFFAQICHTFHIANSTNNKNGTGGIVWA